MKALVSLVVAATLIAGSTMVEGATAADQAVHYRKVKVDGLDIFYREAGPVDAPTVLLLHGFPTSSHMFRDLMPLLADRYHLVAPTIPVSATAPRRRLRISLIHSIT